MYGYIYITTNLLTGKKYIGQHKASNFDDKYIGSGIYLSRAIVKYGRANFICEMLESCNTKDELNEREIYWINKFNAVSSKNFYNISIGGTGGNLGYLANKKRSETIMGHAVSTDTKQKMSKSALGHTVSSETRQKLRQANLGKRVSEETKQKIRKTMLGKNVGDANGAKRPEIRKKLKLLNSGENNPNFGKHWYNNGITCVSAYTCPDGFVSGRLKRNG